MNLRRDKPSPRECAKADFRRYAAEARCPACNGSGVVLLPDRDGLDQHEDCACTQMPADSSALFRQIAGIGETMAKVWREGK
jgi:hypothetical protein